MRQQRSRLLPGTAEKVKNQSANPGTEAALRRLVDGLVSGKPNYDEITPSLADAIRHQFSKLQPNLARLGAVKSIKLLGVGAQGEDVYTVWQENGSSHWRIALDSKGTANNLQQSWRFDREPQKAVLRDVRTIDWILGRPRS
jgi:hypothetical protein